ncbi:MAG: tetratricopeptide repeat protein [Candidatus Electronema sp. V4]|uniref:tetratricopeptide repeat protein n=1 Tax=Candidatus Electronema sp. V4 TaxID=3454756 RepID=UPI0040559673
MNYAWFEKIAPQLASPLVLVGFVLMLAYGVHWQLMKSGLLSKVDKKDSSVIIRLFLRYGFWLALTLLLAGFSLAAWTSWMEKEKVLAVDAGKLAREMVGPLQGQLSAKDEQIKALTEAITALSKTGAPAASINAALQALKQDDTAKAQAIFAEVLRSKEAEGKQANKEAAAAARHLGALAFESDTKAALAAYQKAVQLDPDDSDGWNMLGHLLLRTGELTQTEAASRKVLALGEAHQDKEEEAAALGNLGILAYTRGDLDKAEAMHKKALETHEVLGSKESIAQDYGNLGSVYAISGELDKAEQVFTKALEISEALGLKEISATLYGNLGNVYDIRGELDKAEDMHRKALALHEALDSMEGMARDYANLGTLYEARGNLDQVEAFWKKSLYLLQKMGHTKSKEIQQWLDKLAQERTSQQAPSAASPR